MKKFMVLLTRPTRFGYTEEVSLVRNTYDQGGISYYYRKVLKWGDGHTILRDYSGLPDREYANDMYRRLLADGYTEKSREEFTPIEMDMR